MKGAVLIKQTLINLRIAESGKISSELLIELFMSLSIYQKDSPYRK